MEMCITLTFHARVQTCYVNVGVSAAVYVNARFGIFSRLLVLQERLHIQAQ